MSELKLRIVLPGKPRGQGSMSLWTDPKTGGERAKYADAVVAHRNLLVGLLRDEWSGAAALDEPVAVRISARFARPSSHWLPANSRRAVAELKADAPKWWAGFPDQDKISRLVNDGLTIGGVIRDDSLVVVCRVEKVFADASSTEIEVWTLNGSIE